MADLALRLKVFIASPSDVLPERNIAEQEIVALQGECARERLLLEPYRWEGRVPPTLRRVQAGINFHLRTAELTVAILGTTLGSVAKTGETGSVEEIRIAGERVARGYADDVFLYFKATPPTTETNDQLQAVRDFRHTIAETQGAFVSTFADTTEFSDKFRQDLKSWVTRFYGVPDICAFALREAPGAGAAPEGLGENRLARLKLRFDPSSDAAMCSTLGAGAIRMYQERGVEAIQASIPKDKLGTTPRGALAFAARNPFAQFQPFIDAGVLRTPGDGSVRFSEEEWFYFFCAYGLLEAVSNGDVSAVERRPYINPIHQYLQALTIGVRRPPLIAVLRRWLLGEDGAEGKPIARNFAAYVLGMVNAIEAQEDLGRAISEDAGEDVQFYCVASLGRMRARSQLPVLVDLFHRTDDQRSRLMIAQAVSRMIGIADYPL